MGSDFSAHASMLSSVQNHCNIHTQVPATIQSSASFLVMLCSWVAGTILIRNRIQSPQFLKFLPQTESQATESFSASHARARCVTRGLAKKKPTLHTLNPFRMSVREPGSLSRANGV